MHLRALERVHARVAGHARHAAHPGGEHELLRAQHHGLALLLDRDLPLLLRLVPARVLDRRAGPVVELHQLRVALEPVADLVLRAEHRPIGGERQIRQMVVPDRIVQAQALVAIAPAVTGARILLDDDRGHAELAKPRAENDAGLAAADDQRKGLLVVTERALLLLAFLQPGLAARVHAMLHPFGPRFVLLLLKAFQLLQGREKRPGFAADQAQMAPAATDTGFKREPAFGDAVGFAAIALDLPVRRFRIRHRRFEHGLDLTPTFSRLDVPGERDQVAPVRIVTEHRCRVGETSVRDRGPELIEPLLHRTRGGAHWEVSSLCLDAGVGPERRLKELRQAARSTGRG